MRTQHRPKNYLNVFFWILQPNCKCTEHAGCRLCDYFHCQLKDFTTVSPEICFCLFQNHPQMTLVNNNCRYYDYKLETFFLCKQKAQVCVLTFICIHEYGKYKDGLQKIKAHLLPQSGFLWLCVPKSASVTMIHYSSPVLWWSALYSFTAVHQNTCKIKLLS